MIHILFHFPDKSRSSLHLESDSDSVYESSFAGDKFFKKFVVLFTYKIFLLSILFPSEFAQMKILWKHSKLNYNLADRNPISWCNRLDWCPSKVGQMHWENTIHTTFAISLCVVTTKLITSSSLHISVITMRGHSGTMGPRIHYVTWISRLDRTSCRAAKTPKKLYTCEVYTATGNHAKLCHRN